MTDLAALILLGCFIVGISMVLAPTRRKHPSAKRLLRMVSEEQMIVTPPNHTLAEGAPHWRVQVQIKAYCGTTLRDALKVAWDDRKKR